MPRKKKDVSNSTEIKDSTLVLDTEIKMGILDLYEALGVGMGVSFQYSELPEDVIVTIGFSSKSEYDNFTGEDEDGEDLDELGFDSGIDRVTH